MHFTSLRLPLPLLLYVSSCVALFRSVLFCSVFGSSRVECVDWSRRCLRALSTGANKRLIQIIAYWLCLWGAQHTAHTQWSYTNKAMIHRKKRNKKNRKATAASRKNRSAAKEITTTIIKLSILSRSLLTTLIFSLPCARSLFVCPLSLSISPA